MDNFDFEINTELSALEQRTFDAFREAINSNDVESIKEGLLEMSVVAQNNPDSAEVQFYYYLAQAALDPQECIKAYNQNPSNYCASLWSVLVYARQKDIENSYSILNSLSGMTQYPKSNIAILDAARSYLLDDADSAIKSYEQVASDYTPVLTVIKDSLSLLLSSYVNSAVRQKTEKENAFVLKNIFNYTGSLAASNAAVDIEKNPEFLKFQKEAKAIIADYEKRALAAEAKLKEYEARASVAEKKAQDLETGSESQKMILKTKVEAMLVKQKTEYENLLAQRRSEYEKLILAARKAQAEAEAKYAALAKKVGHN